MRRMCGCETSFFGASTSSSADGVCLCNIEFHK